MKKLTLVLAVTMLAFVATSIAAEKASAFTLSTSVLGPVNESGVRAQMVFVVTRTGEIKVAGFSSKLFRLLGDKPFFSLLYHNNNCAGDPNAGFVDFWFKNRRGKGRLSAKITLTPESIENFDSVSIRDMTINDGRGPEALVACGVIKHPN